MSRIFETAIEAFLDGDYDLAVASLIGFAIVLYIFYLIVKK
jgi:hypothetical protein